MSRKKQIEDMARILCGQSKSCLECTVHKPCLMTNCAEIIYNAGYRKQSVNTVVLPCNIGDICYPLPRYKTPIVERKVSRITYSKRNIIIGYYENDGQYRPPFIFASASSFVRNTSSPKTLVLKGGLY